jgi:hypothetical protein
MLKNVAYALLLLVNVSFAADLPERYTGLLDYVQEAPDQGESDSCLYVASTGAMELIANKKHDIRNPEPYGDYDLSESFLIHAPATVTRGKYMWEIPVLKFNNGYGIHISDWPYVAWNGTSSTHDPWEPRDWDDMKKIPLPKVMTKPLFVLGDRWSMNVLSQKHIDQMKQTLWENKAPILINFNDNGYWHVVLIVGYDDTLPGDCYQIKKDQCKSSGSFYVRDSFGIPVEVRSYDWYRVRGNAAFLVKEAE